MYVRTYVDQSVDSPLRNIKTFHLRSLHDWYVGIIDSMDNIFTEEISGPHGGEYEDGCLLGCCAV
jgi:hypothetical protein